jgi:type IX secretion system PorP/SprF family membrane protein
MTALARKLTYVLTLILISSGARGQQLPLYSQYLYNRFLINPAVAGSDGFTSVNITAREQWVGYSGAPRTYSFSAQSRILKRGYIIKNGVRRSVYRPKSDGKVGLGSYIFNDRNGLIKRTGFQFAYSYHMWMKNATQLSMGLAFSGYHYMIDEKELSFEDPSEPWLSSELRRGLFIPDASFGIYLLNSKFSVGFSADQLFEASMKIGNRAYKNLKIDRHYYIFGNYYHQLNRSSFLEPSVLIMTSSQMKPLADIGLTYIHDNSFWGGLAVRTSGALIANLGVKYQKFFIGYAFDFTFQEIQRVTYGTHEITMALKFGDSARRYRWLNRY